MTEQSKEQTAARLRAIVDHAAEGILTIDEHGHVESFNKACESIFGYAASEAIGSNVSLIMPTPAHGEPLWRMAGAAGREAEGKRKDGTVFPLEVSISDVQAGNQRILCAILRDITGRKLSERRLQDALLELKLTNDDLATFTYIASHDLRSPLVNLKGFSGELHRSIDTIIPLLDRVLPHLSEVEQEILHRETCRMMPRSLQYILSSVEKMDRLTGAILKLSRLGRQTAECEPIHTRALVENCLSSLKHQIEKSGVAVELGELPDITGDKTAIEQVFGNMLDNSLKYLDRARPGRIRIHGTQSLTHAVFTFEDNGRGIARDELHKVFEIFRRAGNVENIPGEGMGMAYVRAIIRRHGGDIWCDSTPGKGTAFHFTIARQSVKKQEQAA